MAKEPTPKKSRILFIDTETLEQYSRTAEQFLNCANNIEFNQLVNSLFSWSGSDSYTTQYIPDQELPISHTNTSLMLITEINNNSNEPVYVQMANGEVKLLRPLGCGRVNFGKEFVGITQHGSNRTGLSLRESFIAGNNKVQEYTPPPSETYKTEIFLHELRQHPVFVEECQMIFYMEQHKNHVVHPRSIDWLYHIFNLACKYAVTHIDESTRIAINDPSQKLQDVYIARYTDSPDEFNVFRVKCCNFESLPPMISLHLGEICGASETKYNRQPDIEERRAIGIGTDFANEAYDPDKPPRKLTEEEMLQRRFKLMATDIDDLHKREVVVIDDFALCDSAQKLRWWYKNRYGEPTSAYKSNPNVYANFTESDFETAVAERVSKAMESTKATIQNLTDKLSVANDELTVLKRRVIVEQDLQFGERKLDLEDKKITAEMEKVDDERQSAKYKADKEKSSAITTFISNASNILKSIITIGTMILSGIAIIAKTRAA